MVFTGSEFHTILYHLLHTTPVNFLFTIHYTFSKSKTILMPQAMFFLTSAEMKS